MAISAIELTVRDAVTGAGIARGAEVVAQQWRKGVMAPAADPQGCHPVTQLLEADPQPSG